MVPDSISLILLPGMHGSGELFAPLLRELPGWIRPVVVSYPPDQPLDYARLLDHVMAALPGGGPFVLLGESFSGPLALMAAALKPKGLRGIILCSTFVTYPLSLPASLAGALVSLGIFRLKSSPLFARILLGASPPDELKTLFVRALARVHPAVLATRAQAVRELNVSAELKNCPVPVLIIQAGNDRIICQRNAEQMRELRPDADIAVIGGPHLILQCATIEAAREMCRFMERL